MCVDLPLTAYLDAWTLQTDLVAARWEKRFHKDIILLLEHPPVFTLGRRGSSDNLIVSEEALKAKGIPVIQVERGGDITYHGPGQLVVYPVMDLTAARIGVADYVAMLEEVIIRTAGDWGINAERNPINRGVWAGRCKLASIGIAVRRGISFHGAALNVNLSMKPFGWINPCGLRDIGMTSMKKELGRNVSMQEVRHSIRHHIKEIFRIDLIPAKIGDLALNTEVN